MDNEREADRPESLPTVALAHDYLLVLRGAERTFAAIADEFSTSPIYTLLYDANGTRGRFSKHPIITSRLQRLGIRQRGFRWLLPAFPFATSRLGTDEADLIVSSSSAFAHGVTKRANALHICYCYTPFRYIWHEFARTRAALPGVARPTFSTMAAALRRWDYSAVQRVDRFIAISKLAQARIADIWGRDSRIIYPPVEVDRMRNGDSHGYFLLVGELVAHKRTEIALQAARRVKVPTIVVGTGPEEQRLRRDYGGAADFVGRVNDDELVELLAHAKAFIMPNVEEFGIAAVEAQGAGRPVIAVAKGGALETVVDGSTGTLVPPDNVDALAEAMREVDGAHFDSELIVRHAQRFGVARFRTELRRFVEDAWSMHPN